MNKDKFNRLVRSMGEALEKLNLRKINALVAEHVLEIPVEDHGFSRFTVKVGSSKLAVPPYSTDIAAAWDVVEKLKGDEGVALNSGDFPDYGEGWHCMFDYPHSAYADTAPLAICLAALKSRGVLLEDN